MSGIHQFVPMLHRRDAVGEHARALRDLLRAAGYPSEIYIELPDPETEGETRPFRSYEDDAAPGDVLVYQFATRSAEAGWLQARPEPVVVNYHSITPPSYFGPWNDGIARSQAACQVELAGLAPTAALGIAVSRFDEAELRSAGCRRTEVVPVVNSSGPGSPPDPDEEARLSRWAGDGPLWLSVGRLAPNKRHESVLAAFYVYRREIDPSARLVIVGAPTEPNYAAALRRYRTRLGLDQVVALRTGLTPGQLAAHYRSASVLVSLSEHEGFGVPLVEAMRSGLPIVARAAGAVTETVGEAGLLLRDSGPRGVAASVSEVLHSPDLVSAMVAAAPGQLTALGVDDAPRRLVEVLGAVARAACGDPPPTK